MREFRLMTIILAMVLSSAATVRESTGGAWLNNFEEALSQAKDRQLPVLINFSGSDWCKPCIRLSREVFDTDAFGAYAEDHLVLVQADFPRLKKNQLSRLQQKQNEELAERYNPFGTFPLVVLVDSQGRVLGNAGYLSGGAENFISVIEAMPGK